MKSIVQLCGFFGRQKDSMQRIFIKKCFLFTGGSVCRLKRFTTGWRNSLKDARQGAEVAETTVKRLTCCGFRRIGKAMGQVYQCWWRICREINLFSRFEYHMFHVLYPFMSCLLTLPLNTTAFECSMFRLERIYQSSDATPSWH
jgi:hypothetical protein